LLASVTVVGSLVAIGLPAVFESVPAADAAPACTVTGNLQVIDTDNDTVLGYVSNVWNSFGEYVVTTTPSEYLDVSVPTGSGVDITASNGPNPTYPFVGGIVGFVSSNNDISSGSSNYTYIGGTTQTPSGSPPVSGANAFTNATGIPEDIESAIWTVNPDGTLVPQWVNTDSSTPVTHLVDITGILATTGDTTAFGSTFGAFSDVALSLVPTSTPCSQSIAYTSSSPTATVGGPSYNPAATATSGLPVAFSIDGSSTAGACSISGSTVDFTGVGSCVIDAGQAGGNIYAAAPQQQQTISVGQGSQTISFTSSAPIGATVGGPSYTPIAAATSGLPVAFSIDGSSTTGACSNSGSTVDFTGAGSCVIDANQAGDTNYLAAGQVSQTISVGKTAQTISFTSSAPSPNIAGPSYTPTATATSGLSVAFSIDGSSTGACSISGSTVSFIGAGACVIDANQAGDANYLAAAQVSQIVAVGLVVPGPPTNLVATAGIDQIALDWAAPSFNGGTSITGYQIFRGTASGGEAAIPIATVSNPSYTDTSLLPGTTYYYTVIALNGVGISAPSHEVHAVISPRSSTGKTMAAAPGGAGYWIVSGAGSISAYGSVTAHGSPATSGLTLVQPVVGMASTPSGQGYWLVASDGGIFSYGDAQFYGSMGGFALNAPIVGMAPTADGGGYWLVASDGGVFAFGDAQFHGSMGGQPLVKPIVGIASTPDGLGYWLVASDGGVFSFGDAQFEGSTGGLTLNAPIVAMTTTSDGSGYWLVASDGGVFSYGDASYFGSLAGTISPLALGLVPNAADTGYTLVVAGGLGGSFGSS